MTECDQDVREQQSRLSFRYFDQFRPTSTNFDRKKISSPLQAKYTASSADNEPALRCAALHLFAPFCGFLRTESLPAFSKSNPPVPAPSSGMGRQFVIRHSSFVIRHYLCASTLNQFEHNSSLTAGNSR